MSARAPSGLGPRRGAAVGAAVVALASLVSCADHRRHLSSAELVRLQDEYNVTSERERAHASGQVIERMRRERAATAEDGADTSPIFDVLIISGGADYGAFGAGVLAGWGTVKAGSLQRPVFDAVTGVSTGAFIAPFALVGTDASYAHVLELFRNPKPDWATVRDWFFFLPGRTSFLTIEGLKRDVASAVDADLVAAIAVAGSEGRSLSIGTTNIDLGAPRAWMLEQEAQRATTSGDLTRIHKILFASVAIPGAFPAVEIDGSLYVDGGATSPILFSTDANDPKTPITAWEGENPGTPYPRVRYWVIVNNQLRTDLEVIQPQWPRVVEASLSTSIRAATVTAMRLLALSVVVRRGLAHEDVEFRYIAIPDDWHAPKEGPFEKDTMRSLADLGYRLGADPNSWREQLAPP